MTAERPGRGSLWFDIPNSDYHVIRFPDRAAATSAIYAHVGELSPGSHLSMLPPGHLLGMDQFPSVRGGSIYDTGRSIA